MQLVQILPRRWRELPREAAKFATSRADSLNRLLPARLQGISHEVVKFGLIGVINLIVNFAVFNLLWYTVLRSGEVKAKALATIVATTCAYFMNRHWTYRDRPKSTLRREYTLFAFFNAVGLVIEVAVVWIAKYGFHQTNIVVFNVCTGVGIVLGTVFRFWAYRNHVFKLDTAAEEPKEPALISAAAALADVPDAPAVDGSTEERTNPTNGTAMTGTPVNGAANGTVNGPGTNGTALVNGTVAVNGGTPANGSAATRKRPKKGARPAANGRGDEALEAELTQIELDDIVAGEQTSTRIIK